MDKDLRVLLHSLHTCDPEAIWPSSRCHNGPQRAVESDSPLQNKENMPIIISSLLHRQITTSHFAILYTMLSQNENQ